MCVEIFYFNPEQDMALANNTPYYKMPAEIGRMADDLAVLPAWFAAFFPVGKRLSGKEIRSCFLR